MEEEMDNVNPFEHDESPVLDFGRHKGRTYMDVALNEPHYCSWATQLQDPGEKMAKFVEWLAEHRVADEPEAQEQDMEDEVERAEDGSQVLAFGRHRGRTYMDVAINEPGWCRAVREMHDKDADVQRFVDWLQTFEEDTEATAASGETEVEADNYEYWAEQEDHDTGAIEGQDSYHHHCEAIDEMEGIAHAEPGAFSHGDGAWESSEDSVDDDASNLWHDASSSGTDNACQELFAAFEEENSRFQCLIQEEGNQKREREEEICDGATKRARTCASDVMLALGTDLHITPELKLA